MLTRPIPRSGEALPVIGCGTYRGFDRAPGHPGYDALAGVAQALFTGGGRVVDTSPMYGRAEQSLGEVLARLQVRDQAFIATKVWTEGREAGIRQMQRSLELLQTGCIDLMQIHNLLDWQTHLPTLRSWQSEGRIRYTGVTHYTASAHAELAEMLRREPVDFVQLNYSLEDRAAEKELLPLAAARGIAVLVNMPFGGGRLLRSLQGRALPAWAATIGVTSWSQLLLKFVLSHPAVTCVIPGSGDPAHMLANTRAGQDPVPAPEFWDDVLGSLGL